MIKKPIPEWVLTALKNGEALVALSHPNTEVPVKLRGFAQLEFRTTAYMPAGTLVFTRKV